MLSSLKNVFTSPLTKYMSIAIGALVLSLGGALYLSYKFYGDKQVAEMQSEQLQSVVEEERKQTAKAVESQKIREESFEKARQTEAEITEAAQRLKDRVDTEPAIKVPEGCENVSESTTSSSNGNLSDDSIRLLQQAHCLSDGDTGDCPSETLK